ncbi:MAG: carboxypeptidase-like regulatory domain-containing protein [Dysgonamonadaceae bacterium]|jgi:hypothetical protein|nr:carboxypeptidase-like regulatory domain-containing protein [Dysgonamonadaceae bacterium]
MKTTFKYPVLGLLIIIMGVTSYPVQSQDNTNGDNNGRYFIISGIAKNKSNNKKLEYVNVSVPGTNIGTITNEDGEFSLKINESIHATHIEFSCVGFYNSRFPVSGKNVFNETFHMTAKPKELPEIVIRSWEPKKLIEEAISKIPVNYSNYPNLLTGFYRETAKKRRSYINIAEAVIQIYKTPYDENVVHDRVQILKGRKLLSTKKSDTLAVKLVGGPNLSILTDIVKNPDILLDKESIGYFKFSMADMTLINDRPHFVVKFEPLDVNLPYALYYGKFFIDTETLAFTRAEFNLDMKDRTKATEMILKRKPAGLRFKPDEVSYIVSYKQRDGITYLNYIRSEIKFKCDWKRRLFSTSYEVMSEMVVTDNQTENVTSISRKDAFNINNSLSDKVMNFYDEDFWGAYNIIEPTESLESAVNKLKKGYN